MNPLDEVMKAVAELRKQGCAHAQELLVAPDVYAAMRGIDEQKGFYSAFCGIDIFVNAEMPEGQMALVPAGADHKEVIEMLRLRRDKEKNQFTIPDQRHAEWLNWMERKGYIVVKDTKYENGQVVKVVDLTEEGKRISDTEKFERDKEWFFETGKLPD